MCTRLNTRERLLDAARELFAERGFHNATVRDIAARARTNLASINYYFGSKDDLYREVMRRSYRRIAEAEQTEAGAALDCRMPPEERLRNFVRGLIPASEATGEDEQHRRLIAWEHLAPTGAVASIEEIEIMPHLESAKEIVRTFLPDDTSADDLAATALWLTGQCLIFRRFAEPGRQDFRPVTFGGRQTDRLVELVTGLALQGLGRAPR